MLGGRFIKHICVISGRQSRDKTGKKKVAEASIEGDRRTLKADSLIPATMAIIYLLLMIYFKAIGGYKPVSLKELEGSGSGNDSDSGEGGSEKESA